MKRLILFLWLLIGANIFGANPAFTAFRGTNGFKISTNVSQGVVIFDSYFTNTFLNTWTLNAGGDLSNALATLPNNSTLYITPGAWTNRPSLFYQISGANFTNSDWHIKNKTNINIIGIGKPDLWVTNYGDHITMSNCSRVLIDGLAFRNSFLTTGQVAKHFAGVQMEFNRDIVFRNNDFLQLGSFGIDGSSFYGMQSSNVIVYNNYFQRVGTLWAATNPDGTGVECDSFWDVHDNTFDECLRGVELFTSHPSFNSVGKLMGTVVRNNRFINPVYFGILAPHTNLVWCVIEGNTFTIDDSARKYSTNTANPCVGIALTSGFGCIVRNNNFPSFSPIDPVNTVVFGISIDSGIVAVPPRDFQIFGNSFSNCPSPIDIRGNVGNAPALNYAIKDNYMINSRNSGILLCQGNDHVIEGNTIINCGLNSGAPLFLGLSGSFVGGTNNVIRNNRIYNSSGVSSVGAGILIAVDQATNVFYGNLVRAGSPFYQDNGVGTKINPDYSASILATYNAGGVYTNQPFDSIVRLPNSTVASGARTNLLRLAASMNGQIITIEDKGMTASGAASNIWLLCAGSDTINHGPPRTNQANNGGTITVQSDGVSNWSIIGKFP